jgi:hypothetical protein
MASRAKQPSDAIVPRLREQIYTRVMPLLAQGLAAARHLRKPKTQDLAETYQMALTVLLRLLFIGHAEARGLLPRQSQRPQLRTLTRHLLKAYPHGLPEGDSPFGTDTGRWQDITALFEAVRASYATGLFVTDPETAPAGALLAKLSLPDTVMGPVLWHLLTTQTAAGYTAVDLSTLDVREVGTIYEGLLESELAVAETDLTIERDGIYRPCRPGATPVVKRGQVYLHDRSGARKTSGSYFTPAFAVDHLLDRALDPAIAEHLARLEEQDEATAGARFFDIRVADLAMGSGHFLVAAARRIERGLAEYLAKRSLPGVRAELDRLRSAAAAPAPIAEGQLLRRLIVRRCIYGVDANSLAVELARLSLWIDTFVPGLPLPLLEHHLVRGDALVGIGRIAEIEAKAKEDEWPLFPIDATKLVGAAMAPLERLAHLADATSADIDAARSAMAEARAAVRPAAALCDIVTACQIDGEKLPIDLEQWEQLQSTLPGSRHHRAAQRALQHLDVLHFPVAFPEVFLRPRAGFDVIVGNPPWEEATVEEHAFWARHEPGLRGLGQRDQEKAKARLRRERPDLLALYAAELGRAAALRQALTAGPYPGMGTGDPDVYKAFCWRSWDLLAADGWLGVVLPRSALTVKGSTAFRRALLSDCAAVHVTMLQNTRGWVFADAEHRYTIALVAAQRGVPAGPAIHLRGPYNRRASLEAGVALPPSRFTPAEVLGWTDSASLPVLPGEGSLEVFAQMRRSPRLDLDDPASWRARPYAELHATNDKGLMDLAAAERPVGYWPVFKGESFDLWQPDTGRYFAWADPAAVLPVLQEKRRRASRSRSSPLAEFDANWVEDPATLPALAARIAFRDISRATDARTVRVALVPPRVFLVNNSPYFLWPRGNERDQAYLLGVLASLPLDWYARRFVETHVNYFLLNPLPVPRPPPRDPRRERVIALAGRLATTDERFADWARAVGVACGPLTEIEKEAHIHELDAVVARLYGLEEKQLVHVFETFHEGWEYSEGLRATVNYYRTVPLVR